jgi:hypothetical protein
MGAATTARAAKPTQAMRRSKEQDDQGEVERVVKHQPLELRPNERGSASSGRGEASSGRGEASSGRGEMREVERIVRRMTRDEKADIPVEDADGNVFIVRKGAR